VFGVQSQPAVIQNRRFAKSPTDALTDLEVWCGLCQQIPVYWLDLRPLTHWRITVVPKWRPACR